MAVAEKGAQAGAGMDKMELKKAMIVAKRRPMHCAIAQGPDGKAVLMIDKMKKGPALYRALKTDAPDTKNHRFGMLEIDPENRKLCRFIINKASAGGMARKLIIALKGTGFNKVQIMLEDGTPVEAEEGEDDEMDLDAGAEDEGYDDENDEEGYGDESEQAPVEALSDYGDQQPLMDAMAPPEYQDQQPASGDQTMQPMDPAAQNGGLDAASLTQALTGLVKQMIGVIAANPTMKTALAEMATDAQASLKRGDLQQASAGIDILRQAMSSDSGAPAGDNTGGQSAPQPMQADSMAQPTGMEMPSGMAQPTGMAMPQQPDADADDDALHPEHIAAAPSIAKARTAWVATRQKVEGDIGKLHTAFGTAFKGHGQEEQIAKAFRERVETVLNALDEELAHTLESVNRARTRRERAEMVERAHAIMERHRKHIQSDPTISALDSNPFVPMTIGQTIGATIDALSRAIR